MFKITLSKDDKQFVKQNKERLASLFGNWIQEMNEGVFDMTAKTEEEKEERDVMISTIQFLKVLLKTIKILDVKTAKPPTFI
jgi:hypothetical protein